VSPTGLRARGPNSGFFFFARSFPTHFAGRGRIGASSANQVGKCCWDAFVDDHAPMRQALQAACQGIPKNGIGRIIGAKLFGGRKLSTVARKQGRGSPVVAVGDCVRRGQGGRCIICPRNRESLRAGSSGIGWEGIELAVIVRGFGLLQRVGFRKSIFYLRNWDVGQEGWRTCRWVHTAKRPQTGAAGLDCWRVGWR